MCNKTEDDTQFEEFQKIIEKKHNVRFDSYWDLHKWSIQNNANFWEEVWIYLDIIHSKPYDEVLVQTGPGFLDYDWFRGAKLNHAENMLRWRDDKVALICLDEQGNEEFVTFAEMFEEVKLYAAAFRKNGLKTGDRVACFMSNRKEAVFAFLAVSSIGAIWGGPVLYYGAKAASKIVGMMEAKFLISIDSHQNNGIVMSMFEHLTFISANVLSIEKIVLVVSDEKTREKDLSNIRNCVFLEDFLKDGRTPEGHVPDIHFEQLPFNHPVFINFTSGTTGQPKALVQSAGGNLLARMRHFNIHLNLKRGDVVFTMYSVGWSVWDQFVHSLGLGLTLFLYCCSPICTIDGMNFWDVFSKYKVKFAFLPIGCLDKLDKMQIIPSPNANLDSLEIIGVGASPVKKNNILYLLAHVKNELHIYNTYGCSDVVGPLSYFHPSMPLYETQIQAPALGVDIRCCDEKGKYVEGQRGELVICTPAPIFPIGLWKDDNKSVLNSTYLSDFPGVWCQKDEGIINPMTRSISIVGRSDRTLKQKSGRFGSNDIYAAIHDLEEVLDYICVSQRAFNGGSRVVLFIVLRTGYRLTPEIKAKIEKAIADELFEDCVPELILEVPDIPYNINNKRMESLVQKILETNLIPEVMSIRNPECLQYFLNIPA